MFLNNFYKAKTFYQLNIEIVFLFNYDYHNNIYIDKCGSYILLT